MKKLTTVVFLLITPMYLFGHSLVLNVFDNGDNTISIEGAFNTGESAAGALVRIELIESGEVIVKQRLSDDEEFTIEIPQFPYNIILDGGPGHIVEKVGMPPQNGFKKIEINTEKPKKEKRPSKTSMEVSSSPAVAISIIIAFILLFATIIISIKNTNKLINELRK